MAGAPIRRQPVAQADPQTARNRQPRLEADPCGGCRIVGESLLSSAGFPRRLENAPLLIEAFRRPPLHLPAALRSVNVYENPAVR